MSVSPAASQPQIPTVNGLTSQFAIECERQLTNYIGPIAKLLVKTTILQHPNLAPAALIDLLAQHIPQPIQATKFRTGFH